MKVARRITLYDSEAGRPILSAPVAALLECSGPGQMRAQVESWVDDPSVEWLATEDALRAFLKRIGCWDDLLSVNVITLRERALWVLACEYRERRAERSRRRSK